jgi:hypothetical protein
LGRTRNVSALYVVRRKCKAGYCANANGSLVPLAKSCP